VEVATIGAIAAAVVVVGPVLVALITALRIRHDVGEVKQLVNGHSSRMDSRLAQLQAELAEAKEAKQ
jgi:hypothetical protein